MKLVIVAEPDESIRSAIKSQLHSINLEVIDVSDGLAVCDTLKKISPMIPDCVISEVVMPNMNGYELLRRVSTRSLESVDTDSLVEKTQWIYYTSKDTEFDRFWAFVGSCLSGYVHKTDGQAFAGKSLLLFAEDPPETIKNLISEFHTTENAELKSLISRKLINYSLPNLIRLVCELIHL